MREKRYKKWSQECKQKQLRLFTFCNISDLLIFRTKKIAWWHSVFKSDFYILSYNEQLGKSFMDKFLPYHTSLNIIALRKTILTTESIYRIYIRSPGLKAASFSVSLSKRRTKGKEEEIRLNVLHVFYIFYLKHLGTFLE